VGENRQRGDGRREAQKVTTAKRHGGLLIMLADGIIAHRPRKPSRISHHSR
jgi:hypothetical protein